MPEEFRWFPKFKFRNGLVFLWRGAGRRGVVGVTAATNFFFFFSRALNFQVS